MGAVAEDTALRVVAGFDELHDFTHGQDFRAPVAKPVEIFVGNEAGALILPNQVFNRVPPIAGDGWEDLVRDGEDASAALVGEAVVKYTGLVRARRVTLDE